MDAISMVSWGKWETFVLLSFHLSWYKAVWLLITSTFSLGLLIIFSSTNITPLVTRWVCQLSSSKTLCDLLALFQHCIGRIPSHWLATLQYNICGNISGHKRGKWHNYCAWWKVTSWDEVILSNKNAFLTIKNYTWLEAPDSRLVVRISIAL